MLPLLLHTLISYLLLLLLLLFFSPSQSHPDRRNHSNSTIKQLLEGAIQLVETNHNPETLRLDILEMDIQQDDAHPVQFVFVDGSFGDLAQEMADTLHISDDVKPLIEKEQKDEVLKKIIIASTAMNTMPEKEFTAAYNLLIYLVSQSESPAMFLPRVCDNLMKPIVSSPANGQHLALNALTTIFNMLPGNSELRFNVFMAILRFVKMNGLFSDLKGTLPQMVAWFREWDTDEEDQRKLLLEVADVASDAGDEA